MADLLFQATNFTSNRSDLPVVQDLNDVFPTTKLEEDAYGHWIFYDNDPLLDKVNNRVLTLQVGATVQPVFSNAGVDLVNGKGNALMSELIDASSTSSTAIYVAKTNGAGLFLLGMTLPSTGSTTENGFGAYVSADKAYLNLKPLIASSTGSISGITTNQTITQATPFLVAVSVDKVKKSVLLYTLKSNSDSFISTNYTTAYENSTKVLAVGNAYYTATVSAAKTTFAEAIIYDRALSLSEIKLVAKRTKLRLQKNNIII